MSVAKSYIEGETQRISINKNQKTEKTKEPPKSLIRISDILWVLGMGAILLFLVLNYMQLSNMSRETTSLKKQLSQLKSEESRLIAEQEKRLSLANVEEVAETKLGMVKKVGKSKEYLMVSGEDKIEVLADQQKNEKSSKFSSTLVNGFNIVLEYLN